MFSTVKNIHFVGIGGIGMSGIAEILINQGFLVSGSDMNKSDNTDYLAKLGAKIFIGHYPENIKDAEVVVYSSAVKVNDNPETKAAFERKIPVIRRAEMLAEVSRLNYNISIAGTHGKTTTTSMIGLILIEAGIDPTVIVGGRLKDLGGTNARLGHGKWTVLEADEYDRSFLQLSPTLAIVNNMELEHLDIYSDFDDLKSTFAEFANKVPFYGKICLGLDDSGVRDLLPLLNKRFVTYGLSKHSDIRATNIKHSGRSSTFTVFEHGKELGDATINIPGEHNVKNALAAITAARELNIGFEIICKALKQFNGVFRRFEIKGEKNGITIIDDYAHHPSEVAATLKAARDAWNRRVVCIFQPHTYTRTQALASDFGKSFDDADLLIVTDVYAARENPIEGISGKTISDAAFDSGHKNVLYMPEFDTLFQNVKPLLQEGDIVLTVGAGSIWKIADLLYSNL
jgi:UDP-N-acetylmuramate--alanine ligase